jgi:AmiR/NasT family two-component response regulator
VEDRVDQEAADERVRHLLTALEHRTVIGQATGIVIERYDLRPEAAFAVLLRISSQRNRKVYEIAEELVNEGHTEGL